MNEVEYCAPPNINTCVFSNYDGLDPLQLFSYQSGRVLIVAYTVEQAKQIISSTFHEGVVFDGLLVKVTPAAFDLCFKNKMVYCSHKAFDHSHIAFVEESQLIDLLLSNAPPRVIAITREWCEEMGYIEPRQNKPRNPDIESWFSQPRPKSVPDYPKDVLLTKKQTFNAECRQVWAQALIACRVGNDGFMAENVNCADWAMEQYIKKFGDKTNV